MTGHRELPLTLQPQGTVHVYLQIANVLSYSASVCHPVQARGLRVYAPGDYTAKVVPFSFGACAKRGPVYLWVSTTVGGTASPSATDGSAAGMCGRAQCRLQAGWLRPEDLGKLRRQRRGPVLQPGHVRAGP